MEHRRNRTDLIIIIDDGVSLEGRPLLPESSGDVVILAAVVSSGVRPRAGTADCSEEFD
jgi:hypothetical protein